MQTALVNQSRKTTQNREWFYFLYLSVLCLMFLFRDVFSVSIPLVIFIGYFTVGFMIFDRDHFLALTAMMPLLGHGIQTNYIILVAIVFYMLKFGTKSSVKMPLVIVVFLMFYEFLHVMFANDSISEYLRYLIQYFFVGLILGESRINQLLKNPIVIIKTFIFMSFYFMIDVLLVTLQYFSFDTILSGNFRFGSLTELIGDKPSLGDNENMVALFAIISIALVLVCMFREKKNYILYSATILYFTFFGLLTASKTFLVCFLLLTVLALLFLFKKSVVKAIIFILLGALVVVILGNTVFSDVFENVLERFTADDITTGRTTLFQLYNDFIFSNAKNSLFGIGLQNVEIKSNISKAPHNAIQEVVLCWGIIGLIMIILLCYLLFKQYRRVTNKEKFIYVLPFLIFLVYIQTIQFVRLSSIFGLLILFYAVILAGGINSETKSISDNG